jgi:hypothetical protein
VTDAAKQRHHQLTKHGKPLLRLALLLLLLLLLLVVVALVHAHHEATTPQAQRVQR